MVDVPEGEIPQLVRPEKKPFMDGETPPHSPEQVEAVTKVFDDDDLLREIIVRVGFPTTLVRAALVCKRWLEHASDPKFLSHFRKLHPPRLLGFYITKGSRADPRFVPMLPQPPELATVMRRLESYNFGAYKIVLCQNGSFFTMGRIGEKFTFVVHRPLCAEKGMGIVPPIPRAQVLNHRNLRAHVSKEEGSSVSYLYLLAEKSMARIYTMQDGGWRIHTLAACLHGLHDGYATRALLVDNKIYMTFSSADHIIVLDLTSSGFFTIQLPQGVKCHYFKSMLSRADDASSVYLMHVEEFQLCVWLHKGDTWLLVDTICLREMLATLGISDHTLENEGIADVQINQAEDIGQFVFLQMGKCIFYLDIKCRTMCKVYENTVHGRDCSIHPFMMIWPPTFPAIKDNPARNAM